MPCSAFINLKSFCSSLCIEVTLRTRQDLDQEGHELTVVTMDKSAGVEDNEIKAIAQPGTAESIDEGNAKNVLTQDEYQLAQLGYKQEFFRGLGLFENW